MKLKNVKLTELNKQELRKTEGGWRDIFKFEAKLTDWFIRNKNTRFVKDTFAGQDAYYP